MTETAERLKAELVQLTDEDRAELAQFLIDSLDDATDPDAEDAWDTELARRADEVKTGKASGEPAEQVFADLRAAHS